MDNEGSDETRRVIYLTSKKFIEARTQARAHTHTHVEMVEEKQRNKEKRSQIKNPVQLCSPIRGGWEDLRFQEQVYASFNTL